jgi:hypothetical protein
MKLALISILIGGFATFFVVSSSVAQSEEWASVSSRENTSPVSMLTTAAVVSSPLPGPGLRMKKTGTTLTVVGAAMLIGGIALISSADDVYYSQTTNQYGTYQEGDPKGALGAVMLVGGAGMTVTGIILWSKGARKYRRHLELQDNAQAVVSVGSRGLSLAFRF